MSARERVRAVGGDELVERLEHLDALPTRRVPPEGPAPLRDGSPDFDVLLLGGGLSVLYAPILASKGHRVAVVERSRAAAAHREWNASRPELERLVELGITDASTLDRELIVARYDHGVFRWAGQGEQRVTGVLDCAVDAGALLDRARAAAERAGVTFLDRCEIDGETASDLGVAVRVRGPDGARVLTGRVALDGRGAASPYATSDLVCPTVGGVLRGLEEGDGPLQTSSRVGEILVTTEGIVDGRQHLWEAFPGRAGETTVYLFYYAESGERRPGALIELYDRFFATLPTYKRGEVAMVRPTFGVITGWTRLSPGPTSPHPRIVLVGDAAARHSPLTFCGFGATLRALPQIAGAVEAASAGRRFSFDDPGVHRGTGALALLLARPPREVARAGEWNALFHAAFETLEEMGQPAFGRLLRDEMSESELRSFLTRTSAKRPRVYLDVLGQLGLGRMLRWGAKVFAPRALGTAAP